MTSRLQTFLKKISYSLWYLTKLDHSGCPCLYTTAKLGPAGHILAKLGHPGRLLGKMGQAGRILPVRLAKLGPARGRILAKLGPARGRILAKLGQLGRILSKMGQASCVSHEWVTTRPMWRHFLEQILRHFFWVLVSSARPQLVPCTVILPHTVCVPEHRRGNQWLELRLRTKSQVTTDSWLGECWLDHIHLL